MSEAIDPTLPALKATPAALPDPLDPLQLAYAGFLARYRGSTLETYRCHLDSYLRWMAARGMNPLAAGRPHVEVWLRDLEDAGLSSATRNARFGVVRLFYRYAVIDALVAKNPCEHVTRPKIHEGEQRRTWLPILDYLALLRAAIAAGPREHLLIALLGEVAMRVGEVCSLDVEAVGHAAGWRTVTFRAKGGDTHREVIPPQLSADLDRLIGERVAGPLFLTAWGTRMDRRAVDRVLQRLCRVAGVTRDITPHGLRRAAATNMLAQGVPLPDVQRKLRHANPRETMRYDQGRYGLDRSAALGYASHLYGMLDAG